MDLSRPPTLAPHGIVCSPHALASAAGLDALRAGGSAVDAALATSAVLAVVYPHMTGIGGDAFWLIYEADSRAVRYLGGAGRAARTAGVGWFAERGHREIPLTGVLPATLTVPGAVDSWCVAHGTYGKRALEANLAAAVGYARHGFPVTARLAASIAACDGDGILDETARAIFLPHGRPPVAGELLRNPDLARALERIAAGGRDGFYAGETAAKLTTFARDTGGFFDPEDFAQQRSAWGEPIRSTYRGIEIVETPPPTQGFTVLEMLNLIEPDDVGRMDPAGPDLAHLLVQAKQIAYGDRDTLLADPAFADVPVERLISKVYAAERRKLLQPDRALPWDRVPSYGSLRGDTVFMCVVDAAGNAVALIQSLYGFFGSGVVVNGTGIVLQNRSAYFSLDPQHPNRLEAGKRPLHTLIASMAFQDGALRHVVGCMGADGQPQIHLQIYVGLIDFGRNMQEALDAPRFLSGRFSLGEPRDLLNVECRFPAATLRELERRGHAVNAWPDWVERAGHAHGISIDPNSGVRVGGADARSDGAAIGY